MSGAPAVSVVMAVRDDPEGLASSAASVLRQEGAELELIVVDDGSRDGTDETLERLANSDPRVRPLCRPPRGLTAALREGCATARGRYIARQDAGDLSLPGRLQRQVQALDRHPEVVLVACWTRCVGPGGEHLYDQRSGGGAGGPFPMYGEDRPLRPAHGPGSHGSTMFRANDYFEVGGYRPEFALGQDWDLWQRLGLRGSFLEIGETLYERTQAPSSLSFACADLQREFGRISLAAARRRAEGGDEADLLEEARRLSERFLREIEPRRRRGRSLGLYHVGETLRKAGDRRAVPYLREALAQRPTLLRAWVRLLQAALAGASRSGPGSRDLGGDPP